jgi:hypothetical protein
LKNKLDYYLIFGGLAVLIIVVFIGGRALIKKSTKK